MPRLNVHLVLDEKTEEYCRKVNEKVRLITDSVIVFGAGSLTRPHISLVFGDTVDETGWEAVARGMYEASANMTTLRIAMGPSYIEAPRQSYVFSDVEEVHDNAAFALLNAAMRARLEGPMIEPDVDYSAVRHLTLAYVQAKRDEVSAFLATLPTRWVATACAIELSHAGPKGTCTDSLARFEFATE